jgi:hypothetical protein
MYLIGNVGLFLINFATVRACFLLVALGAIVAKWAKEQLKDYFCSKPN